MQSQVTQVPNQALSMGAHTNVGTRTVATGLPVMAGSFLASMRPEGNPGGEVETSHQRPASEQPPGAVPPVPKCSHTGATVGQTDSTMPFTICFFIFESLTLWL